LPTLPETSALKFTIKRKALEAVFTVRKTFAWDGTPENNDKLAGKYGLFQPSGICSEFNNVAYVCNTANELYQDIQNPSRKLANALNVLEI